jgi:magnesium transporter
MGSQMTLSEARTDERRSSDTAAAHLVRHVPRAYLDETVRQVFERLRQESLEYTDQVYLFDQQDAWVGSVDLTTVLQSPNNVTMGSLLDTTTPSVRPETDQEDVAAHAIEHRMTAVPVVDRAGTLLGVVPPKAIAGILRDEHLEDIARMAGITHANRHTHRERLATPILEKARRRLPWLIVGLVGSAAATLLIAEFEGILTTHIAVSFFIPALVYLAGAVGSQSVSVAVRDLSSPQPALKKLIFKEFMTGSLIGILLGSLMAFWTWQVFGEDLLWLSIGIAVALTAMMSTVIGLLLPWMFETLDMDPALGSGPIATILQDVVTIVVYLLVVVAILG